MPTVKATGKRGCIAIVMVSRVSRAILPGSVYRRKIVTDNVFKLFVFVTRQKITFVEKYKLFNGLSIPIPCYN